MRICILSNGPSANLYDPDSFRSQFDVVIGVNQAVEKWKLDWWVFNNPETFRNVTPIGHPKLMTRRSAPRRLGDEFKPIWDTWPSEKRISDDIHIRWPRRSQALGQGMTPQWNSYSGLSALGLAGDFGATSVDLYGYDMTGDLDLSGRTVASRVEGRWELERQSFAHLIGLLVHKGIEIERHQIKEFTAPDPDSAPDPAENEPTEPSEGISCSD